MSETPLMSMLTGNMRYMTQRQGVLAQNVANLDTPGYTPKDLKPIDFGAMASQEGDKLALRTTSPKHNSGAGSSAFATEENHGFEISPTKNSVSLEQQMALISETGAHYQISSSLYRKFIGMYRAALGNR